MRSLPCVDLRSLTFVLTVLGLCSVASACPPCTPDRYAMYPGMAAFVRPDMLLLLPILSGTLERPFYSLAGYKVSTLAFSIQANFLGILLANLLTCLSMTVWWRMGPSIVVALGAPVLIALGVKLAWFASVPREAGLGRSARVGLFVAASVLSTIVIAAIPAAMTLFGTDRYSYAEAVRHLKPVAMIVTAIASLGVLIHVFARYRRSSAVIDRRRGFDVMPVPLAVAHAT